MRVEDSRAHCLSQILFLKKFISDYRRLSVQKKCVFSPYFFLSFLLDGSSDFPNFYMRLENSRAHPSSQSVFIKEVLGSYFLLFLKKDSIPDYKG